MSKTAVNQVIQRAIGDAAFRRQLERDPGKALAGFDLTTDERSAITSGDPTRLTALGVDQRMSKAFGLGGLGDASKVVVGDSNIAPGSGALIDEGTVAGSAGNAALISPDSAVGGSMFMAADGTAFDPGLVGDPSAAAAASVSDATSSISAANLRRIEGDLDTVGAVDDAAGAGAGGTAAFDEGLISGGYAAGEAADAASSASAANLRRIEGDLDTVSAFEPEGAGAGGTAALDEGSITGGYDQGEAIDTPGGTPTVEGVDTYPTE